MTERMKVTLSVDQSSATIEFLPASGVAGTLAVNADQLLSLIKALGDVHASMLVGKPLPPVEGINIEAIFNTRWHIQAELLTDGSVLSFYHPSFGPVAFLVPHEQVPEMVRLLSSHIEMNEALSGRKPT